MSQPDLQLAVRWEAIANDLLDRTAKFPKSARFSIAARIDNLVIDVMEALVVARYSTGAQRRDTLQGLNLSLARLRVLIRLAYRRTYLAENAYEFVSTELDEAGRMLGGWIKSAGAGRPGHADGSAP